MTKKPWRDEERKPQSFRYHVVDLFYDLFMTSVVSLAVAASVIAVCWLLWIIVSVLFLGGGDSCPQNLC